MNLLNKLYLRLLQKFSAEHLSEFKAYSRVDEILPTLQYEEIKSNLDQE